MKNYGSPVSGSALQAPGSSGDVRVRIKLWLRVVDTRLSGHDAARKPAWATTRHALTSSQAPHE
jgi:hypothetical protein